ncbi:MAG: hypothetical protein CMM74_14115 [Rhodospirillaceae bacterium]|nr:hypothetical protein [Rhodospirillaceae bacterium]
MPSIEKANVYGASRSESSDDALRQLFRQHDLSAVLVKKGPLGSSILLEPEGNWIDTPAFSTDVIDPTGAGDAFCRGFQVGLSETGDPVEAALYGAVSASFVIEQFGPPHACGVETKAVRERLETLRQMTLQV